MNIEKDLFKLQDKEYRQFQIKLCPGVNNIIGVRLPELRKYAKKTNIIARCNKNISKNRMGNC